MANTVNVKKLNKIRDNYPNTWDWMKHKANWEGMCMGAVLNNNEEYIDRLIELEDKLKKYH
jgi:hypothetical protein